jgi:hypothetical protein
VTVFYLFIYVAGAVLSYSHRHSVALVGFDRVRLARVLPCAWPRSTAAPLSGNPELGSCYPHAELRECESSTSES